MLSWKRKFGPDFLILASMLILVGCGSPKSETNGLPAPIPPNNGPITPIPSTNPSPIDPLLQELIIRGVAIDLVDQTSFTGLRDIGLNVIPPLIGEALQALSLTVDSQGYVSGNTTYGIEHYPGVTMVTTPTFDKTGTLTTQGLDAIFANDYEVIRVKAPFNSSNQLDGTIYYRSRMPGDTQCKKVTVTCEIVGGPYPWGWYYPPPNCNTQVDVVTPCRNYVNLFDSNVKILGKFKADLSKVLK